MNKRYTYVGLPRMPQFFDEGRIRVVERYKTSGLSGDEWRFSCVVELLHKGKVRATSHVGSDLVVAATALQWGLHMGCAEIAGDPQWEVEDLNTFDYGDHGQCCQPGCSDGGTVVRTLRHRWMPGSSDSVPNVPKYSGGPIDARRFCERHRFRGDCGLDDSESNYTDGKPDERRVR